MTRETLPNRRATTGYQFTHDGHVYMAHVGRYHDGRLAEIFITGSKVGTGVDTGARESSTIASLALQHGAAIDGMRRSLPRDPNGKAMGPVGALMDLLEQERA